MTANEDRDKQPSLSTAVEYSLVASELESPSLAEYTVCTHEGSLTGFKLLSVHTLFQEQCTGKIEMDVKTTRLNKRNN